MLPTSCTARLSGQPLSPPTTQPTTPRPLLCPAAVEVQQPHRWNDAADFARAAVITHAPPSQLFPPTSFAPCSLPSLHKASFSFVCGSVLSKGHTRKRPKKDTLFEPYQRLQKRGKAVNTKQKMFFSRVPAKEKTSAGLQLLAMFTASSGQLGSIKLVQETRTLHLYSVFRRDERGAGVGF